MIDMSAGTNEYQEGLVTETHIREGNFVVLNQLTELRQLKATHYDCC